MSNSVNEQLAFVFPGQGSQKVGMLADMERDFPVIARTFAEASEVLGYDLWDLIQNGRQEELNLTEKTQPILLVSSVALWRVWQERQGRQPALMAGHSLGEFSALVCAGVLELRDAVQLVRARGAYMQAAVPVGEGSMAAIIGLEDAAIVAACEQAAQGDVVAAVNFNAPGQVIIAGRVAAVDRAIALCKQAGAKRALPLPVSAPFHTALMVPAGEKLCVDIQKLRLKRPEVPVIHNVHARPESDPETIKALLIEQIHSPVQWVASVRYMVEQGITRTVECGPGKVLSGLNKRIDSSLGTYNIDDVDGLEQALVDVAV